MKLGKKARFTAWALAAVIFMGDVWGNGGYVYAIQPAETEESSQYGSQTATANSGQDSAEARQETMRQPGASGEDIEKEQREISGENTGKTPGTESPEENPEKIPEREGMGENAGKIPAADAAGKGQEAEPGGTNTEKGTSLEDSIQKGSSPLTGDGAQAREENSLEQRQEEEFSALLRDYDMYGVLTNAAEIDVLDSPSEDGRILHTLPSGYQVRFLGVKLLSQEIWFQVAYGVDDVEYTGFIPDSYVVTGDHRLAQWREAYEMDREGQQAEPYGAAQERATNLSAFPQSYQTFINSLLQVHPNWIFVPMNTGLEWSDVVANEMVDARNLVDINAPFTWKSTASKDYDMATGQWVIKNGTSWVQASESIVKYYLDPRNFINESSVFQFEQLTYNAASHTESGVEKILSGTFMGKKKLEDGSGGGITYAQAFMKIGKELKISPYFLASRVRQEQGVQGTSKLISGTYPGFEGYYNYFNISATGIGEQVIISGLTEAKEAGWNTRYAALYGGAQKTAQNYISQGQDTFYLQKFDVDGSYNGLYWHQYMQNLLAADNESKNIRNSYTSMGALDNSFVFKVPVYNNMPSSLCPLPGDSLSKPSIKITKSGYASARISWNEVAGAQGYQLYRKEGNGAYIKLKTLNGLSKTAYKDSSITPGKTYTYKVRAFLKLNAGNFYSKYSSEKTADFQIPATSWDTFKVANYTTIKLYWKKADVDGYAIYRKTDSGKYTKIKTIKNNSTVAYKDAAVLPGHKYSYRIRGYKKINGKTYFSAYTTVKEADVKMSVPELSSVSVSGPTTAKVAWKEDSKATGYYVYRSATEKGGYEKVKTITTNKTLNWTDSSILPGNTYYYKVRSYVKTPEGKKNSGYSKAVMVAASIARPAVTNITASSGGVKLKWKKSDGASGYQISRSDSYNGSYKSVKKVTGDSAVTFTDKNVSLGHTYYYKVRAYKTVGKSTRYSSWSAVVCASPELSQAQFVKVSAAVGRASLKWGKISEAQGYKLYRKTGKNGKYQQITNISNPSTVSFTDKGLVKNKVYYYRMRAWKKVNGKVCYSAYSKEWSVQAQ